MFSEVGIPSGQRFCRTPSVSMASPAPPSIDNCSTTLGPSRSGVSTARQRLEKFIVTAEMQLAASLSEEAQIQDAFQANSCARVAVRICGEFFSSARLESLKVGTIGQHIGHKRRG